MKAALPLHRGSGAAVVASPRGYERPVSWLLAKVCEPPRLVPGECFALLRIRRDEGAELPDREILVADQRPDEAAGLTAVVLVGWLGWAAWRNDRGVSSDEPSWILVADFEGPADDAGLARAVRAQAASAVEQSQVLSMIPDDQVQVARRLGDSAALLVNEARRRIHWLTANERMLINTPLGALNGSGRSKSRSGLGRGMPRTTINEAGNTRLGVLVLAAASGTRPSVITRAEENDTSVRTHILAGISSALAQQNRQALRHLDIVRARRLNEGQAIWREAQLLEATIAAMENRWDRVPALLSRVASEGGGSIQGSMFLSRWLVANAFQRLGQLDSAVAYYDLLVHPRRLAWWDMNAAGFAHSFARQRLVVLYAQLGRLEEARQHWKAFSETFTDPDPELRHLIDEARAALARAEQRRRSSFGRAARSAR